MLRVTVAAIAAASICSIAPPGFAQAPAVGVRALAAPMAAADAQTAKFQAPAQVKEVGTTVLLRRPTYTNAGRRLQVSVTTRTRQGKKTTERDVRVIRRNGQVRLKVTGRSWVRVKVRYHAKKAPGFRSYSSTRTYRTWQALYGNAEADNGANAVGIGPKDFLSGLLSSVAEDLTGSGAVGWGISVLFSLGDDPPPDPLEDVKRQLEQISRQLEQISAQIEELSREQAFQSCAIQTQLGTDAVATINSQAKIFRRYANPKDPNRDRRDWIAWARDVLDTKNGSLQRLEYIRLQLLSKGGTSGALQQCAEAFRKRWESQYPALAEDKYYSDVWTYLNYFYQAQLLGLNNVVEAYHILAADAWMGKGPKPRPLPQPKDIATICNNTTPGSLGASPSQYCRYARDEANDVYYAMLGQAKGAGAAYAWNTRAKNAIAVQAKTSKLWVTDLNKYGDRSQCPGPVSSLRPCGPTVGKAWPLVNGQDKGLGYDGWMTAWSMFWAPLLGANNKASSAGEAMEKAGFAKSMTRGLIIYTGETEPPDSWRMHWKWGPDAGLWGPLEGDWNALCFFDTNLPPNSDASKSWIFCDDNASFWYLANRRVDNTPSCNTTSYRYLTSDLAQRGSVDWYYKATLQGELEEVCVDFVSSYAYFQAHVVQPPGWMYHSDTSGVAQFRWPMKEISDMPCLAHLNWGTDTSALQPKNAGGAWTMCGEDFTAWLKTQLPDPPKDA